LAETGHGPVEQTSWPCGANALNAVFDHVEMLSVAACRIAVASPSRPITQPWWCAPRHSHRCSAGEIGAGWIGEANPRRVKCDFLFRRFQSYMNLLRWWRSKNVFVRYNASRCARSITSFRPSCMRRLPIPMAGPPRPWRARGWLSGSISALVEKFCPIFFRCTSHFAALHTV
jgi:hypothetical protein